MKTKPISVFKICTCINDIKMIIFNLITIYKTLNTKANLINNKNLKNWILFRDQTKPKHTNMANDAHFRHTVIYHRGGP